MSYYMSDILERATMAIVDFKNQPQNTAKFHCFVYDFPKGKWYAEWYPLLEEIGKGIYINSRRKIRRVLPYPYGAKVGVREEWIDHSFIDHDNTIHHEYLLKRDWDDVKANWQPASTMPNKAITRWYTVTSVAVKRVSELTDGELISSGYIALNYDKAHPVSIDELHREFISKHPDLKLTDWVELVGLEAV